MCNVLCCHYHVVAVCILLSTSLICKCIHPSLHLSLALFRYLSLALSVIVCRQTVIGLCVLNMIAYLGPIPYIFFKIIQKDKPRVVTVCVCVCVCVCVFVCVCVVYVLGYVGVSLQLYSLRVC